MWHPPNPNPCAYRDRDGADFESLGECVLPLFTRYSCARTSRPANIWIRIRVITSMGVIQVTNAQIILIKGTIVLGIITSLRMPVVMLGLRGCT